MQDLPPSKLSYLAIIKRDWKNPPNLVTSIRMVGTLALPALVINRSRKMRLAGLGLFLALAGTDKLDGWMARKIYGSTELGKILDPLVDKELIIVTLLSILKDAKQQKDQLLTGILLVTLAVLAVREAAVARIKLEEQRRNPEVESAIQSGRVSMTAQSVAVGALLVPYDSPAVRGGKIFLLITSLGASLYSWWDYHRRYRVPRT